MPPGKLPLELKLGLRSGGAVYFQARELSPELPQFFVALNCDPLRDEEDKDLVRGKTGYCPEKYSG
jgi:hypothetical protein